MQKREAADSAVQKTPSAGLRPFSRHSRYNRYKTDAEAIGGNDSDSDDDLREEFGITGPHPKGGLAGDLHATAETPQEAGNQERKTAPSPRKDRDTRRLIRQTTRRVAEANRWRRAAVKIWAMSKGACV